MKTIKTGQQTFRVGEGVVDPKVTSFPRKSRLVGPKRAARRAEHSNKQK